jgi:hypothetical protein
MRTCVLALLMVLAAVPQVQAQQSEQAAALQAGYSLWGMMDGAANFCWEVANYDVAYMEAHQNWLARNVFVRDELDAALAASGQPVALRADSETAALNGIVDILRQATNKAEACANWVAGTDAGSYDAETYLAGQLGLLRERDGM